MTRKKVYAPSGKNFAGNSRNNNFNMVAISDLPQCADCGNGFDNGGGGSGGGTPSGDSYPWLTGSPEDVDPGPYGNCGLLYQTILDIQRQLETGRYTQDGMAAKQHELQTAWAKWNASGCVLGPIKKYPIDPVLDPGEGPGGGGNGDPIVDDPNGGGKPKDNGNGLPFQTLSGAAGGNSGAGGAISTSPKHKNYFWLVVAGSLVGAFLLFGKNNIAGKPL